MFARRSERANSPFMHDIPPFSSFLLVLFLCLAVGALLGMANRSTAWKPALYFGGACFGLAEPAMMLSLQFGALPLADAFRLGAGVAAAGALACGFGSVPLHRLMKAQQARQRQQEQVRQRQRAQVAQRTEPLVAAAPPLDPNAKGRCPNCGSVVLLSSAECGRCAALFGPGSAWTVTPLLNETPPRR